MRLRQEIKSTRTNSLGLKTIWWGEGLPRRGVGSRSLFPLSKPRELTFGWNIEENCQDIPVPQACSQSLQQKSMCFFYAVGPQRHSGVGRPLQFREHPTRPWEQRDLGQNGHSLLNKTEHGLSRLSLGQMLCERHVKIFYVLCALGCKMCRSHNLNDPNRSDFEITFASDCSRNSKNHCDSETP